MQKHSEFVPIHTILVPYVHQGPGLHALEAARHMDAEIILVGVVVVPPEQSLSVGAVAARALRRLLKIYGRDESHFSSLTLCFDSLHQSIPPVVGRHVAEFQFVGSSLTWSHRQGAAHRVHPHFRRVADGVARPLPCYNVLQWKNRRREA